MSSIFNLVIIFIIVVVFINVVVNKRIRKLLQGLLNKKILKFSITVKDIVLAIIIVIVVIFCLLKIKNTYKNFKYFYKEVNEQDMTITYNNEKAEKELQEYKEIIKNETNIENCKNPYIPEGFIYVEGEWNTGFIIEDITNQNQFVWIPCTNVENSDNIPILERKNFSPNSFIKIYSCYEKNDDYKEFLKSALENGGFYVSRYQIRQNSENIAVSNQNDKVWTNITIDEAENIANNMYSNINSNIINGYAYDVLTEFVLTDLSQMENISENEIVKNICDLTDNINELTTEFQYNSVVYRSYYETEEIQTPFSDNRLVGDVSYKASNLGFRTIIYK